MNVRGSLGGDHQAIERKLSQLSDAVEGADFPTILDVFREVDRGLRAHIDGEERYLFPRFEQSHRDVIDELRSEHALRVLMHLVCAARELDTARLAASTGMHLGFHDPEVATQLLRGRDRGGGRLGRNATRHRDAIVRKQALGLVFVKVHRIVDVVVLTGRRIL